MTEVGHDWAPYSDAKSSRTFTRTKILGFGLSKPSKLLAVTGAMGALDGLQAKYMTIGHLGEDEAIAYQVVFMVIALIGAYFCMFNAKWSFVRNFSNTLLAIPVATLADNISIDVQMLKPYFLLIPNNGYLWRIDVFGNTVFSPIAHWVNQQWLMPGLINGYATAIGILASYLLLQYFWTRSSLDSRLSTLRPILYLHRVRSSKNQGS